MHKITFFPLCKEDAKPPNAETFRIDLNNGRKILVDYAATFDPEDRFELRCNLEKLLRDDLAVEKRNYFDIVMFTHLDDDHVRGAGAFLWFERFTDRQSNDRIKMNELWVPAAAILEIGLDGDAELIRAEARHRLRQKKGIRVFSAPGTLTDWCNKEGLDIQELRDLNLVIDAGRLVPGFSLDADGAEFFVHSPFASYSDNGLTIERNRDAIVMQVRFELDGGVTNFLIMADVDYAAIDEIVRMTKFHENEDRLTWGVIDLPHHCSYLGIGPVKGTTTVSPTDGIKWLHEQGTEGAVLVSSSCIVPSGDTTQPPHRQAARYYEEIAAGLHGEFRVTMEFPKKAAPKPLVIEITQGGAAVQREPVLSTAGGSALAVAAPRVAHGNNE